MVPLIPRHEGWLVSCGQNMTQVEFVVCHSVCKGQEGSDGLPLGADGGYQVPQQVIEWLGWLSFTKGPLIHPGTAFHGILKPLEVAQ